MLLAQARGHQELRLKVSPGQSPWQQESLILVPPFQFDSTLEMCLKVLMKEIKIGKLAETLDSKTQAAKWLIN